MIDVDVAIVGAGAAGSAAAAMLGRAGVSAAIIDPHSRYPFDFRCEKFDSSQVLLLRKAGLFDTIARASTCAGELWVALNGRVVDKRPNDQLDILYDTLVNALRAEIPESVRTIIGKVMAVSTGPDRQMLRLSSGEEIGARLIVMSNGLNFGLRHGLGIGRKILSANHSISVGFDMTPLKTRAFAFPALTYFPENTRERIAYLTLFPVGSQMRANLFAYRDFSDPWLLRLRDRPEETLFTAMPGLEKLTSRFEVPSLARIRPVDLYASEGYRQPGVVLVGDAFATSCPAAGTGLNKVLTDVERLCNVHIPRWLASEGMGEDKIQAFYEDPVKIDSDAQSQAKAFHLRSLSTEEGLSWRARRSAKFVFHRSIGVVRQARKLAKAALALRPRRIGSPVNLEN